MYAVLKVQTGFCEQKRGVKRVKKDVAMHITVIAVGKLKEKEYVSLCAEYEKRISRFAKMTLKEVSDFDCDADALAVNKEGAEIIKALPKSAYVVVCDPAGAPLSSEGLAEKLTSLGNCGESEVCFVIGGSCGVSDEVSNHGAVIQNVVDTLRGATEVATNALEGMKVVDIIERIYAVRGPGTATARD